MDTPSGHYVGRSIWRIEDPKLLRGQGRYVDDIELHGMLHAVFVRSPHAHAVVRSIDTAAAAALDGVATVLTAKDIANHVAALRMPLAFPPGKLGEDAMPMILASDEVTYVGEAVAIVISCSRYVAEDAADLVEVDYDALACVIDPREGAKPGAKLARSDAASNHFATIDVGYGDSAAAFAGAEHVLRERFFHHRGLSNPIEPRGILVAVDADGVKVWASTQAPHELRNTIAEVLRLEIGEVRVINCEVGGGFGCKFMIYPEDVAVAACATMLGRPVKWIEDRREHFLSAIQERDQHWDVEIGVDGRGVLCGVRGQLYHDQGAYAPHSVTVPYNSASSVLGPYVLPAYELQVHVVRTNKPPVVPVRGAGYQQGTFVIERLLDHVADELGIDRLEIRRRNMIASAQMPYDTGLKNRAGAPVIYDSGDYVACQQEAIEAVNMADFAERQARAREHGRYLGLGFAHGVKCTGRGPFESATVRVAPTGQVNVYTGAASMGQSTRTTLAQICADALGVTIESVNVVCGDTAFVEYGLGAFGSRQTMLAGSAVNVAAREVREKALAVAHQVLQSDLEAPYSNITKELFVSEGSVHVPGRPDLSITLSRIASRLRGAAGYAFPQDVGVGLEATHHFRADRMAYANSVHACEVEVDGGTGHVMVRRYLTVQDSGKIVNPLTAKGQVCGGIVHGLGNALFEHMRYDEDGQPITATFADYLLATATEVPNIECIFHETLSPLNPMGMKGVGEVSIIPVPAAVASAIENALAPFSVRITETPITPIRVLEKIEQARSQKEAS